VRQSIDGGVTWGADLRTVANGINPALAIDSAGNIGFLYQTLTGGNTWETHIEISNNSFGTPPTPIVLAKVPSSTPVATFLPYLGDYIYLTAIGETFYGVFSANNTPNSANFPNGVTYLRNANFTTQQLLNVDNVTPVNVSIDPFFFSIQESAFPPIGIITPPIGVRPPIRPVIVSPPIRPIITPPIGVRPPIKPVIVSPPVHPIQPPIHPIAPIKTIGPVQPVEPVEPIEPQKPK
jgi:hypothetical protein